MDELDVVGPIELLTEEGPEQVWYGRSHAQVGLVVRPSTASAAEPVLLRIQSSCVFSESLGAIDCDCASQLAESRRLVNEQGGVLIYLYEEGRGAGLRSKFQSIELQGIKGVGTGVAYDTLGIARDPRDYRFPAALFHYVVGRRTVRLVTNNPSRREGAIAAGIDVVESVPLIVERPEVVAYYADKRLSLGHEVGSSD